MDMNTYQWIYVGKDHPKANSSGSVHSHIVVMEQHLGRQLRAGEVVHHLDGNKRNNAVENLALCASESEHQKTYHREQASELGKRPKLHLRAFSESKAGEIRALVDTGQWSYRALGRIYGVRHSVISRIARGVYQGVPGG